MSKRKLFFGTVDVGWRIEAYQNFLREKYNKKFKTFSLVYFKIHESVYRAHYDLAINIMEKNKLTRLISKCFLFIFIVLQYKTFHFISGETLTNRRLRNLEFKILKLFNKNIILHFVGSDIRNPNWLKEKNNLLETTAHIIFKEPRQMSWQKDLCNDAKQYADFIFVSTPDLLDFISGAIYTPVLIDLAKIEKDDIIVKERSKHIVKILHAPSNPEVKGTPLIDKVMTDLIEEFGDLIEYHNTSHTPPAVKSKLHSVGRKELFSLFSESDIVIDQMTIGWYGLQAIEALYYGCSVITYIDDKLEKYRFPHCPIISSSPDDLINVLRIEIQKEINLKTNNSRTDEKLSNRNWIRKHHTIEQNHASLIQAWTSNL